MAKNRNTDAQKTPARTDDDSRNVPDTKIRTERSGGAAATEANEAMGERFSGDGEEGERGYRGRSAPDTPPGSVPGGSYGAGGGVSQGSLPEASESAEE